MLLLMYFIDCLITLQCCAVLQTYAALTWVGIQLYNTGTMYGIDKQLYANVGGNDQIFSVAMATCLLESWPTSLGFQPYVSHLRPDQVSLGYPAPDGTGTADGYPVTNNAGIIAAVKCLSTGTLS